MATETDKVDELEPDKTIESESEFSSSTDENDPTWNGTRMDFLNDDDSRMCDEDLEVENDLNSNLKLKDGGNCSDSMVGKKRRLASDDEDFVDPNKYMRRAPHFVNVSGKKITVFKNFKEFTSVLKDYTI